MNDVPDWLVNLLDRVSLWDAVAFLMVGVFIIWFVTKRGWRWMTRFARAILATADVVDNLRDLPEFIRRTDARLLTHGEQIDGIYHETHSNDGSSIKDSNGRIELSLDQLQQSVEGMHGRLDVVESDIAVLKQSYESGESES